MENTTSPLFTSDLAIGYKGKPVASDISLTLQRGKVTSLLGCNGVGKSTLLKTITGELPPVNGSVTLMGKDINSYSRRELSKLFTIVTTESVLAGGLKVRELVSLGRQPYTGLFGRLTKEDREITETAMKQAGILYKADSYIGELSDGERQKAMIAKAIAQDTPLIILDEPFSFLDVAARIEIMSLLNKLARDKDKAVLLSSHDVSQSLRMSDILWLMTPDKGIVAGTPEQLIESGMIEHLFDISGVRFSKSQNDFVANSTIE